MSWKNSGMQEKLSGDSFTGTKKTPAMVELCLLSLGGAD